MKLPDITPASTPAAPTGDLYRAADQAERAGSIIEQGLTAYSQELIKAQSQRAAAGLTERLGATEQDIKRNPFMPLSQLRKEFGDDLAGLPQPVREQVSALGRPDPAKPADGSQPDVLVPTWAVAGALYDKRAKDAVDDVSKGISGTGWQTAFKEGVAQHVAERKLAVNDHVMQGLHDYLKLTDSQSVESFVKAGDFASARQAVINSRTFNAAEKTQVLDGIAVHEQTKPIFDALRMVNQPAYREEGLRQIDAALATIGDPTQFTKLTAEQRQKYAHELAVASQAHHDLTTKRDAAVAAFQYASAATDPRNPLRIDPTKAYAALNADFAAGKFKGREELWGAINSTLAAHIKDRNEGSKLALDNVAGDAMGQFMSIDASGTPHMAFANVQPQTLTALKRFGADGEKVIEQIVRWDQANEMHGRQARNLPTADESAKALTIEYALATQGKRVAAMGPLAFNSILFGDGNAELGIPAGPISSRDVPHLSELFAKHATPGKREFLVKPEAIAFDEAMEAFPELKGAVQRRGAQRGTLQVSEGIRGAVKKLTDQLASFIDANPGADGRGPPQEKVRERARELLQKKEFRDSFLRIPYTRTLPALQGAAEGLTPVDDGGLEVPEGSAAAASNPPAVPHGTSEPRAGDEVDGPAIGYPAGTRFKRTANGKWKRTK